MMGKPAHGPATDPLKTLGLLRRWLAIAVAQEALAWIGLEIGRQLDGADERRLVIALGLAGRKLRRAELTLPGDELAAAQDLSPGWRPQYWATDEVARAALLIATHHNDDAAFAARFDKLCLTAETTEHVSYMKGLAIFPAGEQLVRSARQGVRSSIAPIFRAVACHNPFPQHHFDLDAWNQMVVKCVFEGVPIDDVVGLHERRNPELLVMLRDLVAERHAAGRPLPQTVHRFIEG
jgi:hypothetical protein